MQKKKWIKITGKKIIRYRRKTIKTHKELVQIKGQALWDINNFLKLSVSRCLPKSTDLKGSLKINK